MLESHSSLIYTFSYSPLQFFFSSCSEMIIALRMSPVSAGGGIHKHYVDVAVLHDCLIEFSTVRLYRRRWYE